ncbi:MAG: glycoside hydrolase family 38 N-terminal domain-containing protein, partial [Chloroflexota bacterium]
MLVERAQSGMDLSCQVELACNARNRSQTAHYRSFPNPVLDRCELAVFDPEAWELYFDFEVLREIESDEGVDLSLAGLLRSALDRFCTVWVAGDPSTWEAARAILRPHYELRNGTHAHRLAAIGHAHLDTAWLWPIAETYRKAVRTFGSQTRYMDSYPEYRFACSQAQHYAWIKARNPDLWERIRARVASGQFVPVGGSWVEPDCNLPSGEALLRQFL